MAFQDTFILHASRFTFSPSLRRNRWAQTALLLALLLVTGCRREEGVVEVVPARHWVERTVAVVAPLGDHDVRNRLEVTAQWFRDNLESAQKYDTLAVRLKLEWYDEDSADLEALSAALSTRDDIIAVVGPFGNDAVSTFAAACQKTCKPLIAPIATSEEIIRRYAIKNRSGITGAKPFLWSLTKSDVSLTETMMSAFATFCQYHGFDDALAYVFAPANTYGQTFSYWAPFFAENYGIHLLRNAAYENETELIDAVEEAYKAAHSADVFERVGSFCVVEDMKQLYDVARRLRELSCRASSMYKDDPDDPSNDTYWQLFNFDFYTYFAMTSLSEERLAALGTRGAKMLQGREGFSPYADPTTGFEQSYLGRFGTLPTFAECKFYDGLLLAAFAACYAAHYALADMNEAIAAITSPKDNTLSGAAWNATEMEVYLTSMERGQLLNFKGAAGRIAFDTETFTTTTHTTYVHWRILEGQIQHIGYFGEDDSQRISNSLAAWKYLYNRNRAEHDFEQQAAQGATIVYPVMSNQYAVVVQGSEGFENYRHQADALSVYQLLRRGGFPDDHIILIIDKDAAADGQNPEPGVIRATTDSPDLLGGTNAGNGYPAAVVDYDNASLTASDIRNILLGIRTQRTPTVLPRDGSQNVFLYWSGHGRNGEFVWRNSPAGQGFTNTMLRETAQAMLSGDGATSRKLFVVAEPCYGEGVVAALHGIPGALGLSGASTSEQSWADNWSNTALVWLSDRFTQNFVSCLAENPATTYRDLFLYCAEHTIGSHAKIVNAANFGNLTTTAPTEFIIYSE